MPNSLKRKLLFFSSRESFVAFSSESFLDALASDVRVDLLIPDSVDILSYKNNFQNMARIATYHDKQNSPSPINSFTQALIPLLFTSRLCQYWIATRINPFLQYKMFVHNYKWQFIAFLIAIFVPPIALRFSLLKLLELSAGNVAKSICLEDYSEVFFTASASNDKAEYLSFICNKKNITTSAIVSHWDFFSKKTFLISYPTKAFVWGQHMLQESKKDRNLHKSTQFIISGAPFRVVDCHRNNNLDVSRKRILYACGSTFFDDKSFIERVDKYLSGLNQSISIYFRPHPRSGYKTALNIDDYKNIHLESSLDYMHFDAVISPVSSIGLEYLLSCKPALFLITPPATKKYKHFYESLFASVRIKTLLAHPLCLSLREANHTEASLEALLGLIDAKLDRRHCEEINAHNKLLAADGISELYNKLTSGNDYVG